MKRRIATKKIALLMLVSLFQLFALSAYSAGPISVSSNQIIENLRITAVGVPGITVNNASNVTIRNVVIHHWNAPGISFNSATNLVIQNVTIIHESAPQAGYSPSSASTAFNIYGANSPGVVINNAKLVRGVKGIYLVFSPGAQISNIQAMDMRAVNISPNQITGHCIQFNNSPGALLQDFSCQNDLAVSRTSDNVNVYQSDNVVIRRGLIVGNNKASGAGIMFENSNLGLVEDVDALQMGNAAFGGWPSLNTSFKRTRTKDNYCSPISWAFNDAGSAVAPASGGLGWEIGPGSSLTIQNAQYPKTCGVQLWDGNINPPDGQASNPFLTTDFIPRAPQNVQQQWTSPDMTNTRCSTFLVGNFDRNAGSDLLCNDTKAPYEKRVAVSTNELLWYQGVWASWCGANVGVGDFNGDGIADMYCNYGSWTDVMIATGNSFGGAGTGNWMSSANFSIPQSCSQFLVGDFNGDGRSDILCHADATMQNRVMLSTGGSFTDAGVWSTWCGANFGVGDFNGDGRTDIYCNYGQYTDVIISTGSSFGGGGTGNWMTSASFAIPTTCSKFLVGDFDGDRRDDILCHNDSIGSNRVMLSNGTRFTDTGIWATWCGANTSVGDFNADGRADLLCDDGITKWVKTSNGTSLIEGYPWFNF